MNTITMAKPVSITLSPSKRQVAINSSKAIKKLVGGGERAHDPKTGKNISEFGLGAEIAGMLLIKQAKPYPNLIRRWVCNLGKGHNCGKDVPKHWIPPTKLDLEIKYSPVECDDHRGVMFMRTPNGSGYTQNSCTRPSLKQWRGFLPDSRGLGTVPALIGQTP